MAEPATSVEVASSVQQASADRVATDTPTSNTPPHQMAPSGFQAVNARLVVEKERASSAASDSLGRTPPTTAAVAQSAAQQTADTPSAESSNVPTQFDGAADISDNATYGTRSRNRTGNARPNYAEDNEMDFEYSSNNKKKQSDAAGAASAGPTPPDSKQPQEPARFVAVNSNAGLSKAAAAKESTPGMATGGPGTISKKRKAAAASNSQAPTPPSNNTPAPSGARKTGGLAALSATSGRDANVMTFHKHKACLNKRSELVADDGTKLSINGEFLIFFFPFSLQSHHPLGACSLLALCLSQSAGRRSQIAPTLPRSNEPH